ncbi:TetR family transcriptional regulator [Blastococcus brunescens]|uniref:TetR family transcriptional regulator n=1 Tax=Blastococcus brunescens TaxID=1564165 RepID=A0ABZ1B6I8_9ACTN|nr:TetR family transcriptional regulator [Blastococcus sp. BMG 8361]WRL64630.1 TetR family transcriptional regulator [Blastococcus sp. BMG 8361]
MGGRRDRGRRRPARPGARGGDAAEEDQLSTPEPARRSGRRPGNPDTRDAVLAAARQAFAERGFDGATIRGIASAAGVDPALVHHYFGSKDKLFLAAIEAPANPADLLPEVLAGGRDDLGRNVVRLLLRVWDGPMQPAALALVRSAITNDWSAKLLREFLVTQVLRRVVGTLDMPAGERELRGSLAASQLIGLVVGRYVLKLEPLVSATPDWLAATIGPTVQRYLTGPIELPGR